MHVGVPGDRASCYNRNAARRRHNQLLMETVSLPTLRHNLMTRGEQTWPPAVTLMTSAGFEQVLNGEVYRQQDMVVNLINNFCSNRLL